MEANNKPNKKVETNLWAQPGRSCWVEIEKKKKQNKYYKAKIISRIDKNDESCKVTVEFNTDFHPSKNFNSLPKEYDSSFILRCNEQDLAELEITYEDMVNMDVLNEAELLFNLKMRYKKDLIFTYIGPTLLVINPYKPLDFNFSPENYIIYTKQANSQIFNLKENPPHVFGMGAKAFYQLINHSKNQAIVISGESGAGKTENTKFVMRFITSLSSESQEETKLQGQ